MIDWSEDSDPISALSSCSREAVIQHSENNYTECGVLGFGLHISLGAQCSDFPSLVYEEEGTDTEPALMNFGKIAIVYP